MSLIPVTAPQLGFRYWRFSVSASTGGTFGEIAEIELLVNSIDVGGQATVTASDSSGGGSASNLNNDNAGDFHGGALTYTITFTFPSGVTPDVRGYSITARNPTGSYPPTAWTLSRSNDGTNYTQVDSRAGQSFTNGEKKTYSF